MQVTSTHLDIPCDLDLGIFDLLRAQDVEDMPE